MVFQFLEFQEAINRRSNFSMLNNRLALIVISTILILSGCGMGDNVKELEQSAWDTMNLDRVSVHDPSVTYLVNENGEEQFYIFGTHIAQAKSKDLVSWDVPFNTEYENMDDNIIYGNTKENLAETFEWAGYDDADSSGGYNLWAPDVIWNPDYKWPNGDQGAYMIYYSSTSTWRRSAIGFAVAKTIEGPYSYDSTVVYSGFTQNDSTDGSDRNTQYENTHLKELIADGIISGFNEEWAIESGLTYNTDYAPNAIDPTLFYDEDGSLWMTYGSWSGGIFILQMDPETGKPIYPGEDSLTEDGRVVDRYFGTKLSGGFHQSGEGPYIVYDEETGYYYLYITYGGLAANGGYNMRLFRSENPEGPYLDAKGNSPVLAQGDQNYDYGIKLLGNYKFSHQTIGYKAAGHNSAFIDKDGNHFLVFHTRFNSGNEMHEVRVHQMFLNEDEWPVPVPYEYTGQKNQPVSLPDEEVVGEFEFINHGTDNGTTMIETQLIQLNENGEISGDITGNWEQKEDGNITFTINDVTYKGILLKQDVEKLEDEVLTFAAIGDNNELIWGSKH